jgi:hypothetical protein
VEENEDEDEKKEWDELGWGEEGREFWDVN